MIRLDSRLVPREAVEAYAHDILLILRHVAEKKKNGVHEETEKCEPYLYRHPRNVV